MIASISWEALDAIGFETVKIFLSLLWQSSVLLGAVGLLTYALRRRRASLRHQLWVAALLITPVLPLLSWIASQAGTPQVQIPLVPGYATRRPQAETGPAEFTAADIKTARPSADSSIGSPREQEDVIGNEAAVPSPVTQSPSREEVSAAEYPWAIVLLIYLCGLGVFVLLMAAGLLRIGKYIRQGRILTGPRITGLFNAARRKLGHTRGSVVIETEAIQIPMTIRTFYPVVALPKDFASVLSNSEWRTVALHEVAHIKRNDPLLLSIVSVLRAVLFFHPLVWLAAREIFTLSEEATDDMVLEVVNKPLPYAKMLTRLTETLNRRMLLAELAVGIVFSKSVLLRRIEAILSDRSEQLRRLSRWTLAMTLAVAFGSLFLAIAVPLTSPGSTTPRHAAGMVQRHLWNAPPSADLTGGISPDGRYLSYVDWTAGNLAVYDIIADVNWLVTKNTTWENLDGWVESSTVSPDGKQIAYSWCNEKDLNFYDLRIIEIDGSNMRVLYHDPRTFYIVPLGFSPDGETVLAYFSDREADQIDERTGQRYRISHLVLVSIAEGSVHILKTWQEYRFPRRAVFSPDGRYVAFDLQSQDDPEQRDIFLVNIDGTGEWSLITHPADDRLLGWTPDGQKIVFTSDRTSRRDLWLIEVTDGAPQDSPRLLMGQFEGRPIGFSRDGSFYYGIGTTMHNVLLAQLDPEGGDFVGEPRIVSSRFVGSTTMGDWSPDGKFLAYRARRLGPGDWVLVIYSVETSGERILSPSPPFRPDTRWCRPRWSPDGQSLLVCGTGQESGYGLYTVDAETGAAALIESGSEGNLRQAVWSPDGKSVYIRSLMSLSRLEVASGLQTKLYQGEEGPRGFDVSPDGRWLAFYRDPNSLVVMPSVGGQPQEVVHVEGNAGNINNLFIRWMSDGEHLLFSKHNNKLWKVHVETGEQQQIGPEIENLVGATMHPDGRQIAFTVQQDGSELWVMENFLPD